jgi:hypothetical protein
MVELAEVFQRYGAAYREKYGERMLPSQRQAMWEIEHCRTEALGGQVYHCDECQQSQYSYHSCKNRHCPKCQNEAAQHWLERQQDQLLATPYFLVTFTLPAELRQITFGHQKRLYNLLFRTSAAALQQLALDPRFVGGQIGMIGVLHTWTRDLRYHPHVHYLVPAGGLSSDGQAWLPADSDFLVHVKPLSILFRAKFRDALKKTDLFGQVSPEAWTKDWVVHAKPVGSGNEALTYLARYVLRVAICNKHILKLEHDQVTFRYHETSTGQTKYCTLPAETFIHRFLQHVLPKGFVKLRYYGFLSPGKRPLLNQLRLLLGTLSTVTLTTLQPTTSSRPDTTRCCPTCGKAMRLIETLRPSTRSPP